MDSKQASRITGGNTEYGRNKSDFYPTPPFSQSEQFIRRCHEHGKPFALLLKSQYWHAKKRLQLFKETRPAYILPLTWRPDFCFGQRGSGSPLMDVMWVVWDDRMNAGVTRYVPLEKPCMEA